MDVPTGLDNNVHIYFFKQKLIVVEKSYELPGKLNKITIMEFSLDNNQKTTVFSQRMNNIPDFYSKSCNLNIPDYPPNFVAKEDYYMVNFGNSIITVKNGLASVSNLAKIPGCNYLPLISTPLSTDTLVTILIPLFRQQDNHPSLLILFFDSIMIGVILFFLYEFVIKKYSK